MQEFDILFEDFGGFDGLYMKMLASGIPTIVQLMWIPFSDLDIRQQFLLMTRLSRECLLGLWNSFVVSYVRERVFSEIKNITDDIMVVIIFPLLELIIPKPVGKTENFSIFLIISGEYKYLIRNTRVVLYIYPSIALLLR